VEGENWHQLEGKILKVSKKKSEGNSPKNLRKEDERGKRGARKPRNQKTTRQDRTSQIGETSIEEA